MACADCGFIPEPFKDWGYLLTPHPRWDCDHAGQLCRYCDSCSAWWHRPGMDADHDEGEILHADCPECAQFAAEDERADLETKLAAAMEPNGSR